jgi:hypothetical protein
MLMWPLLPITRTENERFSCIGEDRSVGEIEGARQGRPETDTFPEFGQFEGPCLSHRQPERRENS